MTGAGGFIGSHLVETLVARRIRGAGARALQFGRQHRAICSTPPRDIMSEVEIVFGDVRDEHFCLKLTQGNRRRFPSRRAHRHTLFLRRAVELRPDEHHRHPQPAERLLAERRRAFPAYLDERGVRHGALQADRREAPAAGPVSLLRVEDRRGQDRGELLQIVRLQRDDDPALQHVRPPPVAAGGHADDHHAGARVERRFISAPPIRSGISRSCSTRSNAYLKAAGRTDLRGETINVGTGAFFSIAEAIETVGRILGKELVDRRGARTDPPREERGAGASLRQREGESAPELVAAIHVRTGDREGHRVSSKRLESRTRISTTCKEKQCRR